MFTGKLAPSFRSVALVLAAMPLSLGAKIARADGVLQYGDQDVLGTATYASDPTAGATLQGLATDAITFATLITPHGFPFTPSVGEFPGTDQIYVGSTQTGAHDGYAGASERIAGPQVLSLDYSALLTGPTISSLTLGIAADDFQNAVFGQPFTASINGIVNPALTAALNGLDQSGPVVQFLSIGINPAVLDPSHILNITIDQGGDGGDGWAVDFLTVGVTTVPSPGAAGLLGLGGALVGMRRRR
jgi:hypothetical protein